MYKVVFVDDEKIIRDKTPKIINFENYGFEVIGVLSSAECAVEYLKQNSVDVIFTDIKMLQMSGLDLAKYIFENYKHIKVIILSGYSDFEYAREAIKYDVRYFLLKPLELKEFKELLIELKKELDFIRKIGYNFNFNFWMDDLLSDVIYDWNLISAKADKLQLDISVENSRVAEVHLLFENFDEYLENKWEYGKASLKNAISNISRDYNGKVYGYSLAMEKNISKMLIIERQNNKNFETAVNEYLDYIIKNSNEILGIEMSNIQCYIYKNLSDWDKQNNINQIQDKEVISKIKAVVLKNYSDDVSLDEIATSVNFSSAYLSRLFKKETGQNFIEYLVNIRIEKAKSLLKDPDMKIYEIAEKVGYKTIRYFSKTFQNCVGQTPSEYRNSVNKI
jgi:two-component system response regulator YesN